ncbi:MAG: MerR family transcriptional regulator [Acidobacteriota bacterium]
MPIRAVARLTGITADTLRVWERRYGFPKPGRSSAGERVFRDSDIERLQLVAQALSWGFRAGEVVPLPIRELRRLLSAPAAKPAKPISPIVPQLIETLRRDDLAGLARGLRSAIANLGPREFVTEVGAPLLEAVGNCWASGELAVHHEHFLSEALSARVHELLAHYELRRGPGPTVLLTTLPGEAHALGLELVALYLADLGAVPRLMGAQTPPQSIVAGAAMVGADVVGLSVSSSADAAEIARHVRWLGQKLPDPVELWLGGGGAQTLTPQPPRLLRIATWRELESEVQRLRGDLRRRGSQAPARGARPPSREASRAAGAPAERGRAAGRRRVVAGR